jgi:outer membrane biosynthesis protein TonB
LEEIEHEIKELKEIIEKGEVDSYTVNTFTTLCGKAIEELSKNNDDMRQLEIMNMMKSVLQMEPVRKLTEMERNKDKIGEINMRNKNIINNEIKEEPNKEEEDKKEDDKKEEPNKEEDKKEEVKKEEPKPKPPEKPKKANKKKKKNPEVAKTEDIQNKTNENFKKEKPKIGMFSYRLGEANVISQLLNNILKKKETNPNFGGVIYENDIEGKQDGIIQLGMALNFDYIILNGVNMSEQKITKIKSYIEELDNVSNIKNLPEDEVKDLKKDNPTNQNNEPPKEEDKNKGNIEQKNNENVNPK